MKNGLGNLAARNLDAASDTGAAVLHLHGGGMIAGSVPIFDGPLLSLHTGWHPSIRTRCPSKTPMPG